jgi:hypothetical protein
MEEDDDDVHAFEINDAKIDVRPPAVVIPITSPNYTGCQKTV